MIGTGGSDWKLYYQRRPGKVKERVRKGCAHGGTAAVFPPPLSCIIRAAAHPAPPRREKPTGPAACRFHFFFVVDVGNHLPAAPPTKDPQRAPGDRVAAADGEPGPDAPEPWRIRAGARQSQHRSSSLSPNLVRPVHRLPPLKQHRPDPASRPAPPRRS